MKTRFRTAQKAPPGWLGTVLSLDEYCQKSRVLLRCKNRIRDIVRVSLVEGGHVEIAVREGIDGLDVIDQFENASREYEQESNYAQCTDNVEGNEYTWRDSSRHQHCPVGYVMDYLRAKPGRNII